MIKEIIESVKPDLAMDLYCPYCDDELLRPDAKGYEEYVVRLHRNKDNEWVLVAYHRDCYDRWLKTLGGLSAKVVEK